VNKQSQDRGFERRGIHRENYSVHLLPQVWDRVLSSGWFRQSLVKVLETAYYKNVGKDSVHKTQSLQTIVGRGLLSVIVTLP
jgi:hypothetical protein